MSNNIFIRDTSLEKRVYLLDAYSLRRNVYGPAPLYCAVRQSTPCDMPLRYVVCIQEGDCSGKPEKMAEILNLYLKMLSEL